MTNEPYVIGGAMKDPVLQAIETAKWCDGAVLDPTIKTPTMTYIHGANKQIEAIRSAYIAERQRLEQRIAELEGQVELWKTHHKTTCYEWTLAEQNVKDLEQHIAELEAALDVRDRKLSDISKACESAGCLDDEAMDEFIFKQAELIADLEVTTIIDGDIIKNLKQRIAELEAQVPNVVTPVNGKCPNCGGYCGWRYCCHCGAKLDWT